MNTGERLLEVCDKAAAVIRTVWGRGLPDRDHVRRAYLPDFDAKTLPGRRVYVYPAGAAQVGRASRGTNTMEYRVAVAVADRYTRAGDPTDEWADALVSFTGAVFDRLGDDTLAETLDGEPNLWPEAAEIVSAYDPAELRETKVYFADMTFTFREEVGA